jgi:hypothetical protein
VSRFGRNDIFLSGVGEEQAKANVGVLPHSTSLRIRMTGVWIYDRSFGFGGEKKPAATVTAGPSAAALTMVP